MRHALSTRSSMGQTHVGAVSPPMPTSHATMRRAGSAALACALALAIGSGEALASERPGGDLRDTKLLRIEFDNDLFVGSDDAFTAGWSVQVHSRMLDEWKPGLAGWIGRFPTLGDDGDGGRIVRSAWGVTQLISTPQGVTVAAPQPKDFPWAGILGGYVSWSAYDNRRLGALQLYLGCIGPCAYGEQAQEFVHDDLHLGDHPQGWSNQLDNAALVNLNYEYRRKLWSSPGSNGASRFGNDLSVGAQAGLGTFADYAEAWLEYRFGWNVPQGFTKLADPPALGVAVDPVFVAADGPPLIQRAWWPYFSVVARRRSLREFAMTEGGRTVGGGYHQRLASTPGSNQLIVGAHVSNLRLAVHVTYYRYVDDTDVTSSIRSTLNWVNVSFDHRF